MQALPLPSQNTAAKPLAVGQPKASVINMAKHTALQSCMGGWEGFEEISLCGHQVIDEYLGLEHQSSGQHRYRLAHRPPVGP